MTDSTHAGWLAGDDYEWAARNHAAAADQPEPPDNVPDHLPPRDALLGDLGGGPDIALLDRFSRTRHVEDDNPPGLGGA